MQSWLGPRGRRGLALYVGYRLLWGPAWRPARGWRSESSLHPHGTSHLLIPTCLGILLQQAVATFSVVVSAAVAAVPVLRRGHLLRHWLGARMQWLRRACRLCATLENFGGDGGHAGVGQRLLRPSFQAVLRCGTRLYAYLLASNLEQTPSFKLLVKDNQAHLTELSSVLLIDFFLNEPSMNP